MNRILVILGTVILVIGLLWPWVRKLPLFRLPGDVVIADGDGPVVVPRAMAPALLESARDQEEWESFSRERLDDGARLSDYYPLTPDTREEYGAWRSARAFVR